MTDKKYNFYLAVKDSYSNRVIPSLWCSAKTYYEENSKKSNQWIWGDPWIAFDYTVDEILKICKLNPPDVFGCSVFVWNEALMIDLGKRVKEQHPNCLIVYGGPQVDIKYSNDYFKNHPWVDIVCPSDGYGEIIIKEILDHYPIQDFEDIPYIYYTNEKKEKLFSKKTIEKRSFNWPENIYKAQEETLKRFDKLVSVVFETARGCPYKCIYCDWGGGTYTKISKKPYTTVLDEIEWLAKNQIDLITIADANFGIMSIDVEIAKHIAKCKREYNYPISISIELPKNGISRRKEIVETLAEEKLLSLLKIAVQTLDEEIKNNIERIDIDFKDQIEFSNGIKSKFPEIVIRTETILGLPGDNYQKTIDQISQLVGSNLSFFPYSWILLPEAPAYSPEMREKFNIGTVKKTFSISSVSYKDNIPNDPNIIAHTEMHTYNAETVVETYSYTRDEWIDMFYVQALATAGIPTGINFYFKDYLKKEHNLSVGDLYDFIFTNFIKNNNFKNTELNRDFRNLSSILHKWVYDETYVSSGFDYSSDFPLLLPIHQFITFIISLNLDSFYQEISESLAEQFNDPKIIDLGRYTASSIIDISYNFDTGRTFKTDYNWLDFFEKDSKLVKGSYVFNIVDTKIGEYAHDFDWHRYDDPLLKKKQFVYQTISSRFSPRFSTTIKLI